MPFLLSSIKKTKKTITYTHRKGVCKDLVGRITKSRYIHFNKKSHIALRIPFCVV